MISAPLETQRGQRAIVRRDGGSVLFPVTGCCPQAFSHVCRWEYTPCSVGSKFSGRSSSRMTECEPLNDPFIDESLDMLPSTLISPADLSTFPMQIVAGALPMVVCCLSRGLVFGEFKSTGLHSTFWMMGKAGDLCQIKKRSSGWPCVRCRQRAREGESEPPGDFIR